MDIQRHQQRDMRQLQRNDAMRQSDPEAALEVHQKDATDTHPPPEVGRCVCVCGEPKLQRDLGALDIADIADDPSAKEANCMEATCLPEWLPKTKRFWKGADSPWDAKARICSPRLLKFVLQ